MTMAFALTKEERAQQYCVQWLITRLLAVPDANVCGHRLVFVNGAVFDDAKLTILRSPRARRGYVRKLGAFKQVEPITDPDDLPPDGSREVYVYFDTAPRMINYVRRQRLKHAFRGAWAGSVTLANTKTKVGFLRYLKAHEHDPDEKVEAGSTRKTGANIQKWYARLEKLGFEDAEHFWRVVKGTRPMPDAVPELGIEK